MSDSVALTAVAAILGLYYFYLKEWDNMTKPRQRGFIIITALVVTIVLALVVRALLQDFLNLVILLK